MKLVRLLLFVSLIGIFGCGDDPDDNSSDLRTLDLQFNMVYDGEPVTALTNFDYYNTKLRFDKFKFFISDFSLDGTVVEEIAFVDMSSNFVSVQASMEGTTHSIDEVLAGDYSNISFGLGVSKPLNETDPSMYTVNDPLGHSGEYWPGWESYIFSKVEGFSDFDNDGNPEKSFLYHNGSDSVYQTVDLVQNISVSASGSSTLHFNIDLKKIFDGDGDPFDINNTDVDHNATSFTVMNRLSSNLANAFEVQ